MCSKLSSSLLLQGDEEGIFRTSARKVGNFVFLSVSLKADQMLNRELQDEFMLTIKAIARRRSDTTHEAQTIVAIKVLDDNDLFPFFRDAEYTTNVDDEVRS